MGPIPNISSKPRLLSCSRDITNKTSAVIFFSIVLLTSCNHVYKRYEKDSFPSYSWDADTGIIFKPKIEDVSKSYQVTFGIRHIYGFQPASLGVTITTVSPSGKQNKKSYEIEIRNDTGEYLSKCGGDLCDLEKVVESNVKYEEIGEYTYFVSHDSDRDKIGGIMEVGLIIDAID